MNPQDPLAALHPLREPPPTGWWPPAPGWWVLAAVVLSLLVLVAWVMWRRYRANAYRRRALAQLDRLYQTQQSERSDPLQFSTRLNALLKSVALVAYPRREVAARSGSQWLDFLNTCLQSDQQFPAEFVTTAYRCDAQPPDPERLYSAARAWIKRHRRPS